MKTYDHAGSDPEEVRAHPWTVSTTDPAARYHDFKANPALVRTSLEDFIPWSGWPAVDSFYELLEWANGPDSTIETNDCAFEGPGANETAGFPKALEVTGRLMILWRDLRLNLVRSNVEWLRSNIHLLLNEADRDFEYGAVGITVCRVRFLALSTASERGVGDQLMLSFWAWGDTEDEVMANLDRTVRNLHASLRAVVVEARGVTGRDKPGPSGGRGRRRFRT